MAYIEPNTTVKFLLVPFDPDYENTMYFPDIGSQLAYMENKAVLTISNNSYQRRTKGVIRVGWVPEVGNLSPIETLFNANYMMFKNTSYESKWFYAFVLDVEYVNNYTVDVFYKIDVIQSWMFNFSFNQCLIDREHVTDDTFGLHTLPENVEHGPYRESIADYTYQQTLYTNGIYNYTPAVCLVATFDGQGQYEAGGIILGKNSRGNYYSGLHFYVWELTAGNVAAINQSLEAISENAKREGVVALFMCPFNFADAAAGSAIDPEYLTFFRNSNIDGYTPRNNKLFCYPYNMLYVDNGQGNSAEYRWEEFANKNTVMLDVWGNISVNCSLYCKPINYKGITGENDEEVLELSGFPMCAWSNDSFKAWVAQNVATLAGSAATIGLSWASILANPLAGAFGEINRIPELRNYQVGKSFAKGFSEGWDASALQTTGTIGATLGLLGQVLDHRRKPPQSSGNSNGNIQYQNGLMTFLFRRKFIKAEYASVIDSFFDMYGYSTHRVGVPNLAARPCYTYVKTVGCSIDGQLPTSASAEIQNIFNKGIRFWRTTATFGSFDPSVNDNRPSA